MAKQLSFHHNGTRHSFPCDDYPEGLKELKKLGGDLTVEKLMARLVGVPNLTHLYQIQVLEEVEKIKHFWLELDEKRSAFTYDIPFPDGPANRFLLWEKYCVDMTKFPLSVGTDDWIADCPRDPGNKDNLLLKRENESVSVAIAVFKEAVGFFEGQTVVDSYLFWSGEPLTRVYRKTRDNIEYWGKEVVTQFGQEQPILYFQPVPDSIKNLEAIS
ncbi:MAG: hypothetical protein F6J98_01770 [Moorea sp. SIO4G2]|nr:hypothetical protein [Moorena sp. SIO4G2]